MRWLAIGGMGAGDGTAPSVHAWTPEYNSDETLNVAGSTLDANSVLSSGLPAMVIRGGSVSGGSGAGLFSMSESNSPSRPYSTSASAV